MRAHWMLLELGLDYECHPLQSRTGETHTDAFKRLNPRHKIPVLRHGALVLTESAAILQYLSELGYSGNEIVRLERERVVYKQSANALRE